MIQDRLDDLMQQLRPEAWQWLMVSAIALTALAGYLYVLKPSMSEYRDLARSWSPDELAVAAGRSLANEAAIGALDADLVALREALYGGPSGLPREQMEAHIIGRLDRIADVHGVSLRTVTPGKAGEVLMFDELPYDVDVSGSYFALYAWLDAVEAELRPMAVKRFQMREGEGTVELQLRLVSYRPRGDEA